MIVSNGRYRAEAELRIIAVDSSVIDVEVCSQRERMSHVFVSDGDIGGGGIGAYYGRGILQCFVCTLVLIT